MNGKGVLSFYHFFLLFPFAVVMGKMVLSMEVSEGVFFQLEGEAVSLWDFSCEESSCASCALRNVGAW